MTRRWIPIHLLLAGCAGDPAGETGGPMAADNEAAPAPKPIHFETAGTYAYECGIHPTMVGGVVEVS